MAVKIRRTYKGAASSAAIDSAGVSSTIQTSIGLTTSPSNWPAGKFFVVVAPGTAQEEKMCVTISGSILTVVDPTNNSLTGSDEGRGVDDTTARSSIAGGSTVYPVFTSIDANEANELTSKYAARGSIVYQGASTFEELVKGTQGYPLVIGANDPSWAQIGEVGIASNAVTTDKINAAAVTAAKIAAQVAGSGLVGGAGDALAVNVDDSTIEIQSDALRIKDGGVTTAKIANGTILTTDFNTTTPVASGGVPVITVSTSPATGGKAGDVWIVV